MGGDFPGRGLSGLTQSPFPPPHLKSKELGTDGMPAPLVREAMLFQARPTSHGADIHVGGTPRCYIRVPRTESCRVPVSSLTALRRRSPGLSDPAVLGTNLPDRILAETHNNRPAALSALTQSSTANFLHTAESNFETFKIFISAYLQIVQIV